ncbi:hypothetical protein O181_014028 [Austropuccinia psidii MF-1]|uniref:Uncharacterized protein n=1 Tax=Austropuccinia psidii MF-1 TaxID=1389203 RepID=A0A9Q3C0F6_9BASI|nr:hypothetical protein [Austropuccinia psidii MF-1]
METKLPPLQEESVSLNLDINFPASLAFLRNPSKFFSNVPNLKPNGCTFSYWSKGLDNLFIYIFNKIPFTDNPNNFESVPLAKGALCFFIQQTISSDLSKMIQNEASPKQDFIEIKKNFKKSTRLMQLDIVIELFDIYNSVRSSHPNNILSQLFTLFDEFKCVGIPLSTKWRSLLVQIFAPTPT